MFSASDKKSTMKDVARDANCHPSSVSLALRGDPRIPLATRERIAQSVRKLDYRMHPLVSAWVCARRSGKTIHAQLPLAYLTRDRLVNSGGDDPAADLVFRAARERALQLGYSLCSFAFSDYARNPRRLNQVLSTRTVLGVLLASGTRASDMEALESNRYSLVGIGRSEELWMHRVAEDHAAGIRRVMELCSHHGYRRPGLALFDHGEDERRYDWIGGFLAAQYAINRGGSPDLIFDKRKSTPEADLLVWQARQVPDVIISNAPSSCRSLNLPCYGLAMGENEQYPGQIDGGARVGRAAVDLLANLVVNNVRGTLTQRQTVLLEPSINPPGYPMSKRSMVAIDAA